MKKILSVLVILIHLVSTGCATLPKISSDPVQLTPETGARMMFLHPEGRSDNKTKENILECTRDLGLTIIPVTNVPTDLNECLEQSVSSMDVDECYERL